MKTFIVLVCFILSSVQSAELAKQEKVKEFSVAFLAICELITKCCGEKSSSVSVHIFGNSGGVADSMASVLLRKLAGKVSVKVTMKNNEFFEEMTTPAIMLFDSKEVFHEYFQLLMSDLKFKTKHLVYAPGMMSKDITKNISSENYIADTNFLVDFQGSSIDLAASYLFTPDACNKNQIKTINRYSALTKRWENSTFYPEKYQNFYNCTIEVGYVDGYTNHIGFRIFQELSRQFSFKIKRIRGETFEDISSSITDIITSQDNASDEEDFTLSSAIFFDYLAFVVPPGEPMTDFERMFAVFDHETWIGILVTFLVSLAFVQVIKFMSIQVQMFVFGRGNRTPILNIVDIFLNGGQHRVPTRNFARYMLTMFVIWSLIFRTCYQSMVFRNMNMDMRHPRGETVEEMKALNFTFASLDSDFWFEKVLGRQVSRL
jgi:hypothetical protein